MTLLAPTQDAADSDCFGLIRLCGRLSTGLVTVAVRKVVINQNVDLPLPMHNQTGWHLAFYMADHHSSKMQVFSVKNVITSWYGSLQRCLECPVKMWEVIDLYTNTSTVNVFNKYTWSNQRQLIAENKSSCVGLGGNVKCFAAWVHL